jgi:DNA-binding FadR family transcriptional regulator
MSAGSTLFVPVRRTRSFDDVVRQIRAAVLDGRVEPGERLPNERELCRVFEVSRSTLREGLIRALAAAFAERSEQTGTPWQDLAELDVRFREAVARACKNQVRIAIMLGISKATLRTSHTMESFASAAVRRSIGEELSAIAEAIGSGEGEIARRRMQRHVRRSSGLGSRIESVAGNPAGDSTEEDAA